MISFELDHKENERLIKAMEKVPEKAERLANQLLKTYGVPTLIKSIVGFIPISNRDKKHAKNSQPLKHELINLGFTVKAKPRFRYLVFPDQGIGRSNPIAQEFFVKGLESSSDQITNKVIEALEEANKLEV